MVRAEDLMKNVNATLGTNVLKMGSDPAFVVKYLPTGVLPVDVLLNGGLPRGRFTQIIGDYSTLKSYVGLMAIAQTQAAGGTCALIDTEHAYDPSWAAALGIDTKKLINWPDRGDEARVESGEMAIDVAEGLIRGGVDLIVFDSVAALLPQAEREKRFHNERVQPARLAQLLSLAMRKLTAANSQTAVLWINQLRMNIGVTFGNPETPTGGKALPFYSSYIMKIRKAGKITESHKSFNGEKWQDGKRQIGQKFVATMEKSKLSEPHREVWFDFLNKFAGVDDVGFLIAQGLECGVVQLSGTSWSIAGGKKKIVGREKFKAWVQSDPRVTAILRRKVLESISPGLLVLGKTKGA